MNESGNNLDAAVTFDFHPGDPLLAARSEARALFFLAGWRRHAAGKIPLKLGCLGEPPDTVLALAELCGAAMFRQTPLVLEDGSVFNRALGCMLPGEAGQRLVLSSDILVLGDLRRALGSLPPECLALAPAEKAQLPADAWRAVYAALGQELPVARQVPLRAELGLAAGGETVEALPYYHGAVILAPQAAKLGETWVNHRRKLAAVLPTVEGIAPRLAVKLAANGKVALTTACQVVLAQRGATYQRLPRSCDGRPAYFESAARTIAPGLLHAPSFCNELVDLSQIHEQLLGYVAQLGATVRYGVQQRGGGTWRQKLAAAWKVRPVEVVLRRLYLREVRPTLRRCGAYG